MHLTRQRGGTAARELQIGFTSSFDSESFKTTLVAVGESMYVSIRSGLLNAANGGDLVDMLGSKILADIAATVEEPVQ